MDAWVATHAYTRLVDRLELFDACDATCLCPLLLVNLTRVPLTYLRRVDQAAKIPSLPYVASGGTLPRTS